MEYAPQSVSMVYVWTLVTVQSGSGYEQFHLGFCSFGDAGMAEARSDITALRISSVGRC